MQITARPRKNTNARLGFFLQKINGWENDVTGDKTRELGGSQICT